MKGYVIAVRQVAASPGILKQDGKILVFSTENKARKYARKEVEGNVFMMISWWVSPCSHWKKEIEECGDTKHMK